MSQSADQLRTIEPGCFVYFIACLNADAIKIGMARDVDRRLRALQGACPYLLQIMAVTPGARETEFAYHKRFAGLHLHGEWFQYSSPIQDEIERLNLIRFSHLKREHAPNLRTNPVQSNPEMFR
jgi:hypothetical protein